MTRARRPVRALDYRVAPAVFPGTEKTSCQRDRMRMTLSRWARNRGGIAVWGIGAVIGVGTLPPEKATHLGQDR